MLQALSNPSVAENADMLSVLLSFEPRIEVPVMSARSGLNDTQVRDALALLASSGQVGFDMQAGEYFHRPLPVQADALQAMHPRLVSAQKLIDSGAVWDDGDGTYRVQSRDTFYTVTPAEKNRRIPVYLPVVGEIPGTRGPCKHVLAVSIKRRGGLN